MPKKSPSLIRQDNKKDNDHESDQGSDDCSAYEPTKLNVFQISGAKCSRNSTYRYADGELQKLNSAETRVGYLYIDTKEKGTNLRKFYRQLRKDGIEELFVYQQRKGSLKCDHVDTLDLTIKKPKEKPRTNYAWYLIAFVVFLFVILFVLYYCFCRSSGKEKVVKEVVVEKENVEKKKRLVRVCQL